MAGLTPEKVGLAMGLTVAAGLCTTIGAILVFFANLANRKFLAGSLGFSAGIMMFLSFVELLDQSMIEMEDDGISQDHAFIYSTLCFFGGVVLTYLLDKIVHLLMSGHHDMHSLELRPDGQVEGRPVSATTDAGMEDHDVEGPRQEMGEEQGDHEFVEDILHPMERAVSAVDGVPEHDVQRLAFIYEEEHAPVQEERPKQYSHLDKASVVTALAVGLHNFPEGLAVFFSTIAGDKLGISLAIAIAVHNVPEGVAVALPVYYSSKSKLKAWLWCFWSGMAEPLGGLLGWLILYLADESKLALGIMFAVVAGMMVFISLQELFVTALSYDPKNKITGHFAFAGMAVMALSLILFRL